MLSRVAHSLYWMTRYVDRAENTARLVDVNLQMLLDVRPGADGGPGDRWLPLVESSGEAFLFESLHTEVSGLTVSEFLVFQQENPNSILSSLSQARENARMIRDQIPNQLWEEVNRLYLFIRSPEARAMLRENPHDLFQLVKHGALLFHGIMDASLLRQEAWHFMVCGSFLERADQTTRLLDVRHGSWPPRGVPKLDGQLETLGWTAVLRSASAWDAYKSLSGTEVVPRDAIEILLLSHEFPRSVRFCVGEINAALRKISGVANDQFSNEAEKKAGRLLGELTFSTVEDICDGGLHEAIDDLQIKLGAISEAVFQTYIHQPFSIVGDEELRQQEEQQQQNSPGTRP